MKSFKKTIIIIFILSLFLVVLFSPYIKAEYLTLRYGDEFVGLERQTHMLDSSRYLRVLNYSENEATVFYISDTGDLITFIKDENDYWKLQNWKTIWSNSGSADSFYWPYYR